MSRLMRANEAVSPVIGTILLVAIVVGGVGLAWGLLHRLDASTNAKPVHSGAKGDFVGNSYKLTLTGPDDVPLNNGRLMATIDGKTYEWPLAALAAQLPVNTNTWFVGQTICVVGASPCLVPEGTTVDVQVNVAQNQVFQLPKITFSSAFQIRANGGITTMCDVPAELKVLGAEITHGPGGANIPVTVALSTNGLAPFATLFNGGAVNGDPQESFSLANIPAGSVLGVQGTAKDSSFNSVHDSFSADDHVYVLRDGDAAPNIAPYANQNSLESFLKPYVDTTTKTMTLAPEEAIMLFEFTSDLSSSAADFQDLVVLFRFAQAQCA